METEKLQQEQLDQNITIKHPYGFIYITTNLINGKRYIGQKTFSFKRYCYWKEYLGSRSGIKAAIKKYGKNNFTKEIVFIAFSKEELNKAEKQYINFFNAVKSQDFYNFMDGGEGHHRTKEVKNTFTKEHKEKISQALKNHAVSQETKEKIKRTKIKNGSNKHSEEWKQQHSKNVSREKNGKARKVGQYTLDGQLIKIWPCMTEAEKELNIKNIYKVCLNRRKTAGGFKWKYLM